MLTVHISQYSVFYTTLLVSHTHIMVPMINKTMVLLKTQNIIVSIPQAHIPYTQGIPLKQTIPNVWYIYIYRLENNL